MVTSPPRRHTARPPGRWPSPAPPRAGRQVAVDPAAATADEAARDGYFVAAPTRTALLNGTLAGLLRSSFPQVNDAVVAWLNAGPAAGWTHIGQPAALVAASGRIVDGRLDLVLSWPGATLLTDGNRLVAMLDGVLPETVATAALGRQLAELTGIPASGNHDDELVLVIAGDGADVTFLEFQGNALEVDLLARAV